MFYEIYENWDNTNKKRYYILIKINTKLICIHLYMYMKVKPKVWYNNIQVKVEHSSSLLS